jgi:hypothetical protein
VKLSRRKFLETLAAAGIISLAPPGKASPSQPPPARVAPPATSPSRHVTPGEGESTPSPSGTDSESISISASASNSSSVSPSTTPSCSYSISASVSPSHEWPSPSAAWVPAEAYGAVPGVLVTNNRAYGKGMVIQNTLTPEEMRKRLEAMEKLGGLMGDSVDDIIRRVYKDVLK